MYSAVQKALPGMPHPTTDPTSGKLVRKKVSPIHNPKCGLGIYNKIYMSSSKIQHATSPKNCPTLAKARD